VRCIRLWAKKRGLYSNKMGFFGGINCNLLVCFVCQLYPQARPHSHSPTLPRVAGAAAHEPSPPSPPSPPFPPSPPHKCLRNLRPVTLRPVTLRPVTLRPVTLRQAAAARLLERFFHILKGWQFPTPIMLTPPYDAGLGAEVWDPQVGGLQP